MCTRPAHHQLAFASGRAPVSFPDIIVSGACAGFFTAGPGGGGGVADVGLIAGEIFSRGEGGGGRRCGPNSYTDREGLETFILSNMGVSRRTRA